MRLLQILLIIFISFTSCLRDDCWSSSFKEGEANAMSNYIDLNNKAIYTFGETSTGNQLSISMYGFEGACKIKNYLGFTLLDFETGDSIILNACCKEDESSIFTINDDDAIIEDYKLNELEKNFLVIDELSRDSSKMEGIFEVHFITKNELHLNNEIERWDDPSRPDSINFLNGTFKAVRI